jgi:phosphatidylglycerol:prolipoprotein diacylglycerol transferase
MSIPFPDISPIAFSIGPLPIRWYALAYLAGFLIGWRYILSLIQKSEEGARPNRLDIDDFLGWAILGVILGGRLGYVLFYQADLYLSDPLAVLKIWQGGMSFHGGALGVIVAMIVYATVKKIPLLRLTDLVCAAVPIGLFFGRISNFINGELFGRVTQVPWGVVFPYGGPEPRHPSQIYEAVLEGAVLFVVLFILMKTASVRNRPGIVSGVFLAGYGAARMFVEFFREPDAHIGFVFEFLTMGQILCLPMILGGLVCIAYAVRHDRLSRAA